jgi:hypothetical protein
MTCNIQYLHASVQCFQNVLAYFATAVTYTRKMILKLTPEGHR